MTVLLRYIIILFLVIAFVPARAQPARDPGVRNDGVPGAGQPLPNLSPALTALFDVGLSQFVEVEGIADGLGPTMNLNSCGGCHSNPAIGGTSPASNPQVQFYNSILNHATNKLPPFITANGPVREARFPSDGGVHDLFTIAGMPSAEGCAISQPPFAAQIAKHDIIFRIPTPVFGAGLIEQIPDSIILANLAANQSQKTARGIHGHPNIILTGHAISGQPNRNGNDGTISRFGWKAQNKSLMIFSGEAYNVEMGITNEVFQTEREENPGCQFVPTPNDVTHPELSGLDALSNIEDFAAFMRLLAPPQPSATAPGGAISISQGRAFFNQVGCSLCHTPTLSTGRSTLTALGREKVGLSMQQVNLFSDLVVHHMGDGLADGVTQGQAGPDEFRTSPLWGLGKRIFFLHDGRTSDLIAAIHEHRSGHGGGKMSASASEADAVIDAFDALSDVARQDLLNFLRSL